MNRRRAFLATLGSGADLVARQGVQFVVLLVLARLATPAEFGAVALLGTVALVGVVLSDAGLGTAILQSPDLGAEDLDTAFWLTAAAGVTLAAFAAVASAPLAAVLGRSDDWPVAGFLSLAILATSLGQVPTALLVKRRAFLRLLVIGVAGSLLAGTVAVTIALLGSGLWALAVQAVALPAATTMLLWLFGGFRPGRRWSGASAARLLGSGRWVLAANVLDASFLRVQALVIGTVFGPASLGRYQRADSTQQLCADATATVVGRVAIPMLAESGHRPDLLRAGFLTGVRSVSAVNAPVMALLAGLSTPLVVLLYGPQWRSAGPFLAVLALAGLLWPLHAMAVNLMYALSWNRQVYRIDVLKKTVAVALLGGGALLGLQAIAWAQVLFGLAALLVNGVMVRRAVQIRVRDQLREIAPVTAVAAVSGGVVLALANRWAVDPWLEVLVLGVGGAALYLGLAVAFRVTAVVDLLGLLRPLPAGSVRG